ncbi:hypothetical protein Cni_G25194 [Canna indica]|uniref:Uncharacterized protein n=1 Tax=Canna indica TaxID=4628 RepID=A0AAQ3KWK9_9LILI|nr:hypothetical protein Cni_G25194 [Canna indica]
MSSSSRSSERTKSHEAAPRKKAYGEAESEAREQRSKARRSGRADDNIGGLKSSSSECSREGSSSPSDLLRTVLIVN